MRSAAQEPTDDEAHYPSVRQGGGVKRAIITPTFRPHFPFNRDWLASLDAHAQDLDDIDVHLIVTRAELADMQALIAERPRVRAHAHAFEDLLAQSGYDLEAAYLLREVGKFAFQCLKKLFALKHLDYDQALIIDSESLLLKPVRVGDAFDDYFADPYVCYSTLEHRNENWHGHLGDTVNRNGSKLLGVPYPKMHLLEYYGWFYDKRIVTDMFAALPADLLAAVRKLGQDKSIFECVLYYTFLYNNQGQYGHRFDSVNDLLRQYLGDEGYAAYLADFAGPWEQVGIFEFVSKEVTETNLAQLTRLFNDRAFRFYRSEIVNRNERVQEQLIEATPICFLVSSENYRRIKERIAVCVSGPPRDHRVGLKVLRDTLTDITVDVFAHFWEAADRDVLVRTLQPVAVEFGEESGAPGPAMLDPGPAGRRDGSAAARRNEATLTGLYSQWRAGELRRAHEQAHGFRYDLVIMISGDVLTFEPLTEVLDRVRRQQYGYESVIYVPTDGHGTGVDTTVALGDAESADVLSRTWLGVADSPSAAAHTDLLQLQHLLTHDVDVRSFELQHVPLTILTALSTRSIASDLQRLMRSRALAGLPADRTVTLGPDHFRFKASSAALVAQLGLERPKLFRLRTGGGWLGLTADRSAVVLTPHEAAASRFYVIAAADADRSAINLRAAEMVGDPSTPSSAANVAPDRHGVLRADALATPEAAFQLDARSEGAVALRWRAGDWRTPTSLDDVKNPLSWWLAVWDGRPVLSQNPEGEHLFVLERVPDRAAEAAAMGVSLEVDTSAASAASGRLSQLAWRLYTAARVFDEGGSERLVRDTRVFARKVVAARRRASRS